ncbi:MAG: peptide chain release factor N(5)-glutamine methyltransferase [Cyclobacteriaceae bacterium]
MKSTELVNEIMQRLSDAYEQEEAKPIAQLLVEEIVEISRPNVMIGVSIELTSNQQARLNDAVERLLKHEPIQHILEFAWFYNRKFFVDRSVLVPRQETEELVALIIRRVIGKQRILDIGTGSGIIPISLNLQNGSFHCEGWDVSPDALKVAAKNATALKAEVSFKETDILNSNEWCGEWDIIVSNPPYVTEKEKAEMSPVVLEHDPHLALFVSNEDPLIFYREIGKFAMEHLHSKGTLFLEINEHFGKETTALLSSIGFSQIELVKDLNNKDRMLICER